MLNFRWKKRLIKKIGRPILALDEAGRGPLAGPVSVGGVFLSDDFYKKINREEGWWKQINDSKRLSPSKRSILAEKIRLFFPGRSVLVSASFIDRFGIREAVSRATSQIFEEFEKWNPLIISDGRENFLLEEEFEERKIVGGDSRFFSIACASILAKTQRDEYMDRMADKWPVYQFKKNKGYGTKEHLKALSDFGPCSLHRFSFAPLKNRVSRKSFSLSKL